jgi:hypothetical protein
MKIQSDRDRITHHYRTWINRQVNQAIGHNGQMPLEEFCAKVAWVTGGIPDAPYPSIQVARGDGAFVWNEEATQAILYETWEKKKDELAQAHLSAHAYGRWLKMAEGEKSHHAHVYARAMVQVSLAKKKGGDMTIDKAIKVLRAESSRQTTVTTPFGRTIYYGQCLTCADNMTCHGARDNASRCNDYTTSTKSPAKRAETVVVGVPGRGESIRIAPPLLRCGI